MNDSLLELNNSSSPSEFPLKSLRAFLLPEATLLVKSFEAKTLKELDEEINNWVRATKAIIAVPSPIGKFETENGTFYIISVTYLPANE